MTAAVSVVPLFSIFNSPLKMNISALAESRLNYSLFIIHYSLYFIFSPSLRVLLKISPLKLQKTFTIARKYAIIKMNKYV